MLALSGALIGIKVLTNALGTEKYGLLSLGLTIAGLLNLFVYGPVSQWVLRFFSIHRERGETGAFFLAIRRIYLIATLAVSAAAGLALAALSTLVATEWLLLIAAAVVFAVAAGANSMFIALQSAIRDRKVVALHQGADAWLRPVLALLALYFFGDTSHVVLLGFCAGTLLVTASQALQASRSLAVLRDREHSRLTPKQWQSVRKEFAAYVLPFGLMALFGAISLYADRWILQGLFGEHEVGIYAVMYQMANAPIAVLVGIVSQLMVPVIYDRAGTMTTAAQAARSKQAVFETVGITSLIMAGLTVVAYSFGQPLIAIFSTPEFAAHHATLWVLVLGVALFNVAQLLTLRGFSSRQTDLYIWPKGIQALSFVLTALALVRGHGILGIAIAVVISSLIYLAHVVWVNRRVR